MAGIEETAVRGDVDIGTPMSLALIGGKSLDGSKFSAVILKNHQFVAQFAEKICVAAIGPENLTIYDD